MLRVATVPKVRFGGSCWCSVRPFFTGANPFAALAPAPKKFHAKKVFRHRPDHVYAVVSDVGRYKEFVPYTTDSRVLRRDGNVSRAQLTVGFPPVSEKYISIVTVDPGLRVHAESKDTSLFKRLRTVWAFHPGTGAKPDSCLVSFDVEFEFATGLHAVLAHRFFDDVSRQMITAFEQRCDELYGKGP